MSAPIINDYWVWPNHDVLESLWLALFPHKARRTGDSALLRPDPASALVVLAGP